MKKKSAEDQHWWESHLDDFIYFCPHWTEFFNPYVVHISTPVFTWARHFFGIQDRLDSTRPWVSLHLGCYACILASASSGLDPCTKRHTKVVPPLFFYRHCAHPTHHGSPLAVTSILLSSCRSVGSRIVTRFVQKILLWKHHGSLQWHRARGIKYC